MLTRVLLVSATILVLLAGPACAQSLGDPASGDPAPLSTVARPAPIPDAGLTPGDDILSTLKANDQFSVLVQVLDRSGLSAVLRRSGPYTLVAPTNEAFRALPPAELAALMRPDAALRLQALLAYHMINAAVPPLQINGGKLMVATIAQHDVVIDATASPARFDDARVQGQVHVSNGYIYVVDKVLSDQPTPPPMPVASTAAPAG